MAKISSKKTKVIILILLVLTVLMLLAFKMIVSLQTVEVPTVEKEIGIVQKEEIKMDKVVLEEHKEKTMGVQNILVIGVDEGGYDNARSDVMIIATIDGDNKILKLTSVMRDTLVYIPKADNYQKLNHSYMIGGPVETMRTINRNLDLDIKDFVVFDFDTVIKAVDSIGGYPVYIKAGETKDMNMPEGDRVLTGKEAIRYMRVRYNSGGDSGRNERQRDLILYIMKYAKSMNKREMLGFTNEMMPLIRTSYSFMDIDKLLDLYISIKDGLTTEQLSFPFNYKGMKLNDGLWYAVPENLQDNVTQLQKELFNSDKYIPNLIVNQINDYIQNETGVYSNNIDRRNNSE